MKYLVIFLFLASFSVLAFAEPVPESEPQYNSTANENCGPGTTLQDGICVVDKTEEGIADSSVRWGGPANNVESTLKQIKSGISIDEIQCRESLTLVTRYDGSPACVTESTKQKLIDRGWGL